MIHVKKSKINQEKAKLLGLEERPIFYFPSVTGCQEEKCNSDGGGHVGNGHNNWWSKSCMSPTLFCVLEK